MGIKSLTEIRVEFNCSFIRIVLKSVVEAPDLLSKISLVVFPYHSRNPLFLKLNFIPPTTVPMG